MYIRVDHPRQRMWWGTEICPEHYARQNAKQWIYKIYNERDDVISLDAINCKISLQEVYAQIKFRQAEFSSKAVN